MISPKHILYLLILSTGLFVLMGCGTRQYLLKSPTRSISPVTKVVVVRNDSSSFLLIPGQRPALRDVNQRFQKRVAAMGGIDTLLCGELSKRNIFCEISYGERTIPEDTYLIRYHDYWNWDLKNYMPVLFLSLQNSKGKELIRVGSQANRSGMHDYPTPAKQIPLLIDLLLKNSRVE